MGREQNHWWTFVVTLAALAVMLLTTATTAGAGEVGQPGPSSECSVENNFADASGHPTVYVFKDDAHFPDVTKAWNPATTAFTPTATAPIKHDMILAVEFQSPLDGSPIDRSSIVVTGPTNTSGPTGTTTTIPAAPGIGTNKTPHNFQGIGYMLYGIDGAGKLTTYDVTTPPNHGVIAYQIPTDAKLKDKDATGQVIAYSLHIHANDSDNGEANPPTQCGNASWTFAGTGDGKGLPSDECTENSLFANGVYPASGTTRPGDQVGAYYSNSSPMQFRDSSDVFWTVQPFDYGINMELTGGGFTVTDSSGTHGTHIYPSATPGNIASTDGYTLTPVLPGTILHPGLFNTRINFVLPSATDSRWFSDDYTLTLKVYDTDKGTLGHDCARAAWTFAIRGATG